MTNCHVKKYDDTYLNLPNPAFNNKRNVGLNFIEHRNVILVSCAVNILMTQHF